MINSYLISVIIPVFNCEKTISRCLHSVCNQTYTNIEILIIYKEGYDKTYQKVMSFTDPRIKVIFQTDDSGIGGARNLGLTYANGQFIGFVEGDDYIDNNFYELLVDYLILSNCDFVFGETIISSCRLNTNQSYRLYNNFIDKITLCKNGAVFDKLFRSDFIKKNHMLFPENLRWEDNYFIIAALYFSNTIATVKGAFYHYNPSKHDKTEFISLQNDAYHVAVKIINFSKLMDFSKFENEILFYFMMRSFLFQFFYHNKIYYLISNNLFFNFYFPFYRLKSFLHKLLN